ncbi:MAG: hypothetical protein WCX46_01505 [Candidatus Paceibacterota bacterium]
MELTEEEKTKIKEEEKYRAEVREKAEEKPWYQQKIGCVGFILIVIIIIVIISTFSGKGDNSNKTQSVDKTTIRVGDDGIINYHQNKNDCSDIAVLGVSKEAMDKLVSAAVAGDNIGTTQLVIAGQAFSVPNCTKVKVIDSSMYARQVRILEGEHFGNSGWLPFEWVK